MTLLLDSCVLIDVLRGHPGRRALLDDLVVARHQLATTAINLGEIYSGMRPHERDRIDDLFRHLELFPITPAVGRSAGLLKNDWMRRGRTLGLDDVLIAAVALENGLPLLTDNVKDFPMPELQPWPLPRLN